MRADRLVSLVLLLRQRGRLSAATIARELEVSPRTVQRDIDALSAAGVPVYAERGRHGGFALLPGFQTELTGLNHDETLALMAAGSVGAEQVFGLGPALASAMRKVVDALPDGHRATLDGAAQRFLVDPDTDILSRRLTSEPLPDAAMIAVRHAVLIGHRLRIRYAAAGQQARWRTVDPIGLVTARDRTYLLARRGGNDRTYRLSRVLTAECLHEQAERPEHVDLEQLWQERCAQFLSSTGQVTVIARVIPHRQEELLATALAVRVTDTDTGWPRMDLTFHDSRHARWALWQLGEDAEALSPKWLRDELRHRALATAARYAKTGAHPYSEPETRARS